MNAVLIDSRNLLFTHKNEIIHQFKDTVAPLLSQQAMRTQSAITYPTTTSSSVRFESLTNSGSRAQLHVSEKKNARMAFRIGSYGVVF